MRKVVVIEHMTLDGVMQGPGRADEDDRGRFEHGGWRMPYRPGHGPEDGRGDGEGGPLLFGRRTYVRAHDAPARPGNGRHLFPDGTAFTDLRLLETTTTTTGIVIARYQAGEGSGADV